jgi:hypothetical protein
MEAEMGKSVEVNVNTAQNHQPRQPADEKLEGKSFRVNENSVEEGEPVHSSGPPPQPSKENPNVQKIQGKAFQMNENSVQIDTFHGSTDCVGRA